MSVQHHDPQAFGERDHGPEVTPTEARQGNGGRRLFWVITGSTILAVLAIAFVWVMSGAHLTRTRGAPQAEIGHFSAEPLTPRQN